MSTNSYWILAGGVVAAAAAGFVLPPAAWLGLVAALMLTAVALVALLFQLDRPSIALLLLVVTAVGLPLEFRGPAGVMMSSSLPLAAALCGLWILRSLLAHDSSAFDRSRVVVSACTFLGLTIAVVHDRPVPVVRLAGRAAAGADRRARAVRPVGAPVPGGRPAGALVESVAVAHVAVRRRRGDRLRVADGAAVGDRSRAGRRGPGPSAACSGPGWWRSPCLRAW